MISDTDQVDPLDKLGRKDKCNEDIEEKIGDVSLEDVLIRRREEATIGSSPVTSKSMSEFVRRWWERA